MFNKGDQIKWVKRQLLGVVAFRFKYAGEELLFCETCEPTVTATGALFFIAPPGECILHLGVSNKDRPEKDLPQLDFKPTEGVQSKVRG